MRRIKDVARAALPENPWTILRKVRRDVARYIDLHAARKALLRSDALSDDEKYLLRNASLRVQANDDMYLPGTGRHYLSIGISSNRAINSVLAHAPHQVRAILDLPSGYGRCLRFLKPDFRTR